jgi:hypothetical protein
MEKLENSLPILVCVGTWETQGETLTQHLVLFSCEKASSDLCGPYVLLVINQRNKPIKMNKHMTLHQVLWYTSVIPPTQEVEIRGITV